MTDTPIAVLSFNRPHYLTAVLDSLAAQVDLGNRQVCLFQDNAVSPHTQTRYAEDKDIAACIDIFREKFPSGIVMLAEHNLGVARNFLRAEEWAFLHLGSDGCFFFEDDMVLSPHYLTMMDRLFAFAMANDRVGYFAAFGALTMPMQQQRSLARTLRRLSYHWGFGLTRRHWTDLRQWLDPFYQMTADMDYKDPRRIKVVRYYQARGVPLLGANQDVLKQNGTVQLGRVSINTTACFAKYIGAEGLHFTQDNYDRHGFGRGEMYPEPVDLDFPTPETLAEWQALEAKNRLNRFNARRDEHRARRAKTAT